jgi:hypothetical protein
VLAAAVLSLTSCSGDGEATQTSVAVEAADTVVPVGFDLGEATITTPAGEARSITVWIAGSAEDRGRGLMGVTDLGDADGMLFVFGAEAISRFYMWRTAMPLDIAFFADDGTFVGSAAMEPCLEPSSANCERYAPNEPFLTALEVPAGTLEELGVGPGTRLSSD